MDIMDLHSEAWKGIRRSWESGRLAHAYALMGSPRGEAMRFAESFLKLLFCEQEEKPCSECPGCRQIDAHQHIDTLWLEPQSKARQIKADEIRVLVHRMAQTSFGGGWKAGIILSADCMNAAASNILLKTLEEPPPRTVLLLVTEAPQSLLPTILSRCQKIAISGTPAGSLNAVWLDPLMQILHDLPPENGLEASRLAGRLKMLFDEVKAGISDAVAEELVQREEALDESRLKVILEARTSALLKEVHAEVFLVMMDWYRDILMVLSGIENENLCFPDDHEVLHEQSKRHTPAEVLNAVRFVDEMKRRLDRNIPDMQVFDEGFRRLVTG
jgi:DNA polymerase-3 subunit delta'